MHVGRSVGRRRLDETTTTAGDGTGVGDDRSTRSRASLSSRRSRETARALSHRARRDSIGRTDDDERATTGTETGRENCAFFHSFIDSIRLDRDETENDEEDDDDEEDNDGDDLFAPREIERDVDVGERDDERDGDQGRDRGGGGRRARVLVATGGTGVEASGEETRDRGVGKDEE